MPGPQFDKSNWIGKIADDFTADHVRVVAMSIGTWMKSKGLSSIMIGYDSRFGGLMFANVAASIFTQLEIKTTVSNSMITSPMLILNMVKSSADIGIMITGSSHPAEYSGIKIKGIHSQENIDLINSIIPTITVRPSSGKEDVSGIQYEDFEVKYLEYIESAIDLQAIRDSEKIVVFDAMYGASQSVFQKILPAAIRLRCETNPSFNGDVPNPIPENLEIMRAIAEGTEYAVCGFATNSDGELLTMCDENGAYLDPYSILKEEENIPWRDGLFVAMKIVEKMVVSGKPLSEL